jgi:hypothetical protein
MILTPKEKAKELVNRFAKLPEEGSLMWYLSFEIAKKCALIAVDEIIELHKGMFMAERENQNESYWQEVKKEIENL